MAAKTTLQGKELATAIHRVAEEGESFTRSVRSMQDSKARLIRVMRAARDGGVYNETLRALLPGMTDAAVEDMLSSPTPADPPAKTTISKSSKKAKAKK